jgi:hypothetical protein
LEASQFDRDVKGKKKQAVGANRSRWFAGNNWSFGVNSGSTHGEYEYVFGKGGCPFKGRSPYVAKVSTAMTGTHLPPVLVLTSFRAHGTLIPHFSRDSRRFSYVEWEKPGEIRDKSGTRSKQDRERTATIVVSIGPQGNLNNVRKTLEGF